jgi:GTP-binding protein
LIDSRRGLLKNDVEVMTLLDRAAVSYQLVLTKTDKLKPSELSEILARVDAESRKHGAAHPELIATSAQSGHGIGQLRAELAALTDT